MKLKIRIDKQNSRHIYCSMFSDEDNCGTYMIIGKLCMTWKEYHAFIYVLKTGAECTENYEFFADIR